MRLLVAMHQIKICTERSKVISKLLSLLMWMYYFMFIRLSVMFTTLHIDTKRELNKIKEISDLTTIYPGHLSHKTLF